MPYAENSKCVLCRYGSMDGVRTESHQIMCSMCFDFSRLVLREEFSDLANKLRKEAAPSDAKAATEFLREAGETMASRGATYDRPEGERSMGTTVSVFNQITGHKLAESDGWLLMQILKDVRQWQRNTYHYDSALDSVAYAALKSEALAAGR